MKIIHVVRQFSPSVGGLESAVLHLAAAQRNHYDVDARVITLNRVFGEPEILADIGIVAGVPVRRLPWRGSTRYPLAPTVLHNLWDADLVHVHAIDFFFDFLALTRPYHGRKMIVSTHGGFFHSAQLAALKKLWFATVTRASIRAYDRVVANSYSDADMFQGVAGRRLVVIENGIDQTRLKGAAAAHQTRTIVYFGRFAHHKRIAELFPLLRELRTLNSEWRLLVAGRPADQTTEELQALANTEGVADLVRFVIDPRDADLHALISQASYFACLSGYEGFGLAAVEAMSAGLFPILSDIGPFRRLIEQAGIGLLADTPTTTAAAIETSLLNDQTAYRARQMLISNAVRSYDWDAVAGKFINLYGDAIGRSQILGPAFGTDSGA